MISSIIFVVSRKKKIDSYMKPYLPMLITATDHLQQFLKLWSMI